MANGRPTVRAFLTEGRDGDATEGSLGAPFCQRLICQSTMPRLVVLRPPRVHRVWLYGWRGYLGGRIPSKLCCQASYDRSLRVERAQVLARARNQGSDQQGFGLCCRVRSPTRRSRHCHDAGEHSGGLLQEHRAAVRQRRSLRAFDQRRILLQLLDQNEEASHSANGPVQATEGALLPSRQLQGVRAPATRKSLLADDQLLGRLRDAQSPNLRRRFLHRKTFLALAFVPERLAIRQNTLVAQAHMCDEIRTRGEVQRAEAARERRQSPRLLSEVAAPAWHPINKLGLADDLANLAKTPLAAYEPSALPLGPRPIVPTHRILRAALRTVDMARRSCFGLGHYELGLPVPH